MNNSKTKSLSNTKKQGSLGRSLVMWFLILSLLPLSIVSWISYQQANDSLNKAAAKSLEQSSLLSVRFMHNWFKYRFMDLNNHAESQNNIKLLASLIEGHTKSSKPLAEYVKSYDWIRRVDKLQDDLINMGRRYDYIYDIFLIDTKGNLLFSIAHESDLGTNLFNGVYAKTLFASSVKTTQQTGQVVFSGLERYAPSNNIIASFITAPILYESGDKLGVIAIQIKGEKVFDYLKNGLKKKSSLTHYLVGTDGKLLTPIHGNTKEVLNRIIDTEQVRFWQWVYKQGENFYESDEHSEGAFSYLGPDGKQVIGHHKRLRLPGVEWVLISEIDEDEALASVNWLKKITLMVFFITAIAVVVFSLYLSSRITKPITLLLIASIRVAAGKENKDVVVNSNNEIGQLADAFNRMLYVRKRHEEELEQTTNQAESAFLELAEQKFALDQHSIVAITDIEGMITFVNKNFCDVSGYKKEELMGENHRILSSGVHDKVFYHDMYKAITNGNVWKGEVCNKSKGGKLYWLDTTIVPFMGDDGKPKSYITIRTDITERKKAETDLVNAKETAEAATQQKSEFLANMSHEIRTPMNGVIGMTGLLLDTKLDSKQRNYADSTMSSAEALLAIINDILDFSKIEAGKMELEILPFDLQSVMEDVSELMAMKCREKNIEMLLHFKPGTEKNLLGDPGRIRQILLNLLSNAVKFTEQGSVLLSVDSSKVIDGKTTISVSVKDSGIGIDDDKLDKIFNKFDQEDGSTTRKYGGTGLGLAICRQLCHLMGGEIKAQSHKGHGSVFSFTMSLLLSEQDAVSSLSIGDGDKLSGLKTLVVDDLDIARTIITEQLVGLKLNIETASSGQTALDKLTAAINDKQPFDIVITDFHMPEMDGEMLAAKIKENKLLEQGALLFVTSSPRKGDGSRLQKLGFDGYLIKPTRALEVPQILSLIWQAKITGKNIPLVTRHMVHEVKAGTKQRLKLKNTHILLSEDNPVNQMVATEYLERYGCRVTPAGNGLEAVTQFKNNDFDLIFMDCQMPEMDGYEATAVIRQWEGFRSLEKTTIIAFTANAMQGDKEKCLDAGMDDYISKPVSEKALEDILKKWLPDNVQMVEFSEQENTTVISVEKEKIDKDSGEKQILDLSVFNVLKDMFGETFSSAVDSHTTSSKENVKRIEDALDNGDANELEHAAHSLKGASAQFGALILSELAKQMEQFGKNSEIDKAKEIFSELKSAREDVENKMLKEL